LKRVAPVEAAAELSKRRKKEVEVEGRGLEDPEIEVESFMWRTDSKDRDLAEKFLRICSALRNVSEHRLELILVEMWEDMFEEAENFMNWAAEGSDPEDNKENDDEQGDGNGGGGGGDDGDEDNDEQGDGDGGGGNEGDEDNNNQDNDEQNDSGDDDSDDQDDNGVGDGGPSKEENDHSRQSTTQSSTSPKLKKGKRKATESEPVEERTRTSPSSTRSSTSSKSKAVRTADGAETEEGEIEQGEDDGGTTSKPRKRILQGERTVEPVPKRKSTSKSPKSAKHRSSTNSQLGLELEHITLLPDGFSIIETRGTRRDCALYALAYSIASQYPSLTTPTINELREIVKTGTVGDNVTAALGQVYQDNFSVEHIAAILEEYGRKHGWTLQLGILWDNRPEPFLQANEDQNNVVTIWIHNNNDERFGHYSGIRDESKKAKGPNGGKPEQETRASRTSENVAGGHNLRSNSGKSTAEHIKPTKKTSPNTQQRAKRPQNNDSPDEELNTSGTSQPSKRYNLRDRRVRNELPLVSPSQLFPLDRQLNPTRYTK
jgi:hypothetical protein